MNQAEAASLATRPMPQETSPLASLLPAGARYASPLQTGARLQEFEISAVIGQGGFGIVYLARDLSLQRSVAIKEYFPAHLAGRDAEGEVRALTPGQSEVLELGRRSFINEARMLARFKHAGLVEVLRFWEQNGTAYMAMPYYDGATLTQYLKRHPGIATEAWLRKTLKPLVDALGHMHEEDCFHRDVAPDNILILKDGSAVLLDLGAARRVIANDAQAMTVMLKPGYAPIEQYSDDPRFRQGPWTDIYAMAAVLFFAVTGKAPPASASRVMRDSVSPLASVRPAGFSDSFLLAIDKGLALQPEDRPHSIAEFRALLYAAPQLDETLSTAPMQGTARAAPAEGSGGGSTGDANADVSATDAAPAASRIGPAGIAAGVGAVVLALAAGWFGLRAGDPPVADIAATSAASTLPAPSPSATSVETSGAVVASGATAPSGADSAATARAPVMAAAPVPADTAAPSVAAAAAAAAEAAAPSVLPAAPAAPMLDTPQPQAPAGKPPAAAASRPAATVTGPSATAPAAKASASDGDAKPSAVGSGTVTLSVKPWGEVRVNGVAKGISPPLKQLTLPAGRYTIELRNPAAEPVKQQVEVRANQKAIVSHQF